MVALKKCKQYGSWRWPSHFSTFIRFVVIVLRVDDCQGQTWWNLLPDPEDKKNHRQVNFPKFNPIIFFLFACQTSWELGSELFDDVAKDSLLCSLPEWWTLNNDMWEFIWWRQVTKVATKSTKKYAFKYAVLYMLKLWKRSSDSHLFTIFHPARKSILTTTVTNVTIKWK